MSQDRKVLSHDQFGCSLSTANPDVIEYINVFTSELLRSGKRVGDILEAVEKYPQEFIIHILAAIFHLYGQTTENQNKATYHLDEAFHLLDHATEREKSLFEMAQYWQRLELAECLQRIERHCFKWPKDLMTIKIAEFLFYCKGQKYENKRFLRLTSHCYSEHKNDSFFLSIHSFALELNEKFDESLSTVKRALLLNEHNPWAHHTLSLIYLKRGWIKEGIELLERYASSWHQFSHIIESHNLWHLALLYLENLDFEKVQEIYKRADWSHQSHLVGEEIDVASLLWRLDLEALEDLTLPLWKELANSIQDHANFGGTPFLSTHLCYALRKGNKEDKLKEALIQIEHFAHEQVKENRFVWKDIGLRLIYGSLAFADKKYNEALQYFQPIIEKVDCVGGSNAQIDLFYQTYLKSLIGAQHYRQAETLLHRMTQGRNLTQLEHKWLAECTQFHKS